MRSLSRRLRRLPLHCWAVLLLLPAGCGKGTGTVTGTVKYGGKAVLIGNVSIHPQDGNTQFSAAIGGDGKFTIPGVPAGPAKVCVISLNPGKPKTGKGITITPTGDPTKWFEIPEKYLLPQESDLQIEVKDGNNEVTLELKD